MLVDLTPFGIASAGAAALALFLEYFPGFSTWYETLDRQWKALIAMGILVAAALVLAGWSCANGEVCYYSSWEGVVQLVGIIAVALGVNYGVHAHTKRENLVGS